MDREILHVDMNNFYASVERLYDPALRGRPIAVGGDAEARQGIILARSDEARAFGVRTGEALWQAKRRCPELRIVPPHFDRYLRFSREAQALYGEYTDLVEPFGLDECWLDVTASASLFGDGMAIAQKVRGRVRRELGLTVSIGVSYNKVFAKLGSDMKKPDAITRLTRRNYRLRAWPLPAGDLLYVGPATREKLYRRGLLTIGDVANADPGALEGLLGKWGAVLHLFANGLDSAPVRHAEEQPLLKSIGNSATAPRDLRTEQDARILLWTLADSVAARLRRHGLRAGTVCLELRDDHLVRWERRMTLARPTCLARELCGAGMALLRRAHDGQRPLRGLGLRAASLVPEDAPMQLSLFEDAARLEREERLERAVDAVRSRFGHAALRRAVLLTDPALGRINPLEDHLVHPVSFFR